MSAVTQTIPRALTKSPLVQAGLAVVVVAVIVAWGGITPDLSSVRIATTVLLYVALASGWNLLGGYAGYINFGTVIFFGLGAYTTAILAGSAGMNPLLTAPIAALVAAAGAFLLGIPSFRLRGDYFAVATFVLTLGFEQLTSALSFTGGATGLYLKPVTSSLSGSIRLFFLLFLVLAVIAVAICYIVEHTRWFSALTAIREDEDAAEALGVPTGKVKLIALVVGSAIAGVTGCLYASQTLYVEPTGTFDFTISLAVVIAAFIGGSGRWYGPLIGAVITQVLAQLLLINVEGVWNQVVFGALLLVVALIAPRGIAGIGKVVRGRRFGV